MSKNFPYEPPSSPYDLIKRGVDRYRANYDRVFGLSVKPEKLEFGGLPIEIDPHIPRNEIHIRTKSGRVYKITNLED